VVRLGDPVPVRVQVTVATETVEKEAEREGEGSLKEGVCVLERDRVREDGV